MRFLDFFPNISLHVNIPMLLSRCVWSSTVSIRRGMHCTELVPQFRSEHVRFHSVFQAAHIVLEGWSVCLVFVDIQLGLQCCYHKMIV